LAAGWTRQKLTERYEIGISGVIDPTAPNDDLLSEIAEVCDGTTERRKAQLEKCQKNLGRGSLTHT
jgi:hypothetical protein